MCICIFCLIISLHGNQQEKRVERGQTKGRVHKLVVDSQAAQIHVIISSYLIGSYFVFVHVFSIV